MNVAEVIKDYQDGMSEKDWIQKHKRHRATLYRIIRSSGIGKKKPITDREKAILCEYQCGISLKEIDQKYNCHQGSLHTLLKINNIPLRRDFVDYGDIEVFKSNYLSKTKDELESLYKTSIRNIQTKARYLGINIDKGPRRRKRSMSKDILHKEYIINNLSSTQIAEKYKDSGAPLKGSVSRLLRKYQINKDPNFVKVQNTMTKELLYQEYIINDLRMQEIVEKYKDICEPNLSQISKLLEKFEIKKDKDLIYIQKCETRFKNYGVKNGPYGIMEGKVKEFLYSLGYEFNSVRRILGKKEIDLYNSDLKLGIEYCGLKWHCENNRGTRGPDYHIGKYEIAISKGIRLITIFEDEWISRKQQVKTFLKSLLNKNEIQVNANDCEICELDKITAHEFIDKNGILCADPAWCYSLGLFYKKELIGAITLSNFDELNSIVTFDKLYFKENTNIVNGEEKLFNLCLKYCKSKGIKKIISWNDHRWNCGDTQVKLGFTLVEKIAADYSYVDTRKVYTRLSKNTVDLTGLRRIWDCGSSKWELEIP